jgi:hypothetical protein
VTLALAVSAPVYDYYHDFDHNSSASSKRGLALKSDAICPDLELFKEIKPWFYGWGAEPSASDYNKSCTKEYDSGFIPMTWSKKAVGEEIYPDAAALLGFNEPNHKEQSNMEPAVAAAEWPAFEAKAKASGIPRLGSPAAAGCGNPSKCLGNIDDWFDKFFAACKGCQVDFIATHTYVCSGSALSSFLEGLHLRYQKPIWITEFNCGDGSKNASAAQHLAYMKEALPILEATSYVERYSWMSTHNTKVAGCALINPQGKLTPLGEYYLKYTPGPRPGHWEKTPKTVCASQRFLSQHGTLAACEAAAMAHTGCSSPKTIAFEGGSTHNCACANTTRCKHVPSNFMNLYVKQ